MSRKPLGQKVYKSMQGKTVDIDLLRKKNELTPAVGNARVNARGDELGPGGAIIKKREDIVNEYYKNTKTVPDETTVKEEPTPPVDKVQSAAPKTNTRAQKKPQAQAKPTVKEQEMFEEFDDGWIEDENGNFVKKGE
jgi:outer membrane biosynthesis protein TonB